MNRQEARNILKNKAPRRYHGTSLLLLSNLVDQGFGPNGPRTVNVKDTTLMRQCFIGSRQLGRTLNRFTKDGICALIRRADKITGLLDLSSLNALPEIPTVKEVKADRAAKARATYAAKRQQGKTEMVQQFFLDLAEQNKQRSTCVQ